MTNYTTAINKYSSIIDNAFNAGIRTNKELRTSHFYNELWLTAFELANIMATLNWGKIASISKLNGFEKEDWVQSCTYKFVTKFEAIAKAKSTPRYDKKGNLLKHNHSAYCCSIFDSFILDENRKYVQKSKREYLDNNNKRHRVLKPVTKTDEYGNTTQAKYSFVSADAPLSSDNSDSICLQDTFKSEEFTPEEMYMRKQDHIDSSNHLLEYFIMFSKHATKGQMYVFIEDTLLENGQECTLDNILEIFNDIDSKSPAYKKVATTAFINAYNKDLERFVNLINAGNISAFQSYQAHSINEFGKAFFPQKEKLSRLRYLNKVELADLLKIERPKQVRKKTK